MLTEHGAAPKNWSDTLDTASTNSNWGLSLGSGTVYSDSTGIYAIIYNPWIGRETARQRPTLATFRSSNTSFVMKITPSSLITQETVSGGTWPPGMTLYTGTVYLYNGAAYIWPQSAVSNPSSSLTNPTNGWIKMSTGFG